MYFVIIYKVSLIKNYKFDTRIEMEVSMSRDSEQKKFKNNIRFYIMYGQTEATARMTCLPYEKLWNGEKTGSVGIPISGGKVHIEDLNTGKKCHAYERGEIIYTGDNVCMGYAESYKDLESGYNNENILKTGDIGYVDKDDYLYITGRLKHIVKLHGKRYNTDEIEDFLESVVLESKEVCVTGDDRRVYIAIECDEVIDHQMTAYILKALIKEYNLKKSEIIIKNIGEIPRLHNEYKSKVKYMKTYK